MPGKIGLTFEEMTTALGNHGWSFHPADFSWRGPGGEPAASVEALHDVCEIYPVLARQMLDILLAGHAFDISMRQEGYVTTIVLQPSPILVSEGPDVFARPVKL